MSTYLEEVGRDGELSGESGGQVLRRQLSELEVGVAGVDAPLECQGSSAAVGRHTCLSGHVIGEGTRIGSQPL